MHSNNSEPYKADLQISLDAAFMTLFINGIGKVSTVGLKNIFYNTANKIYSLH